MIWQAAEGGTVTIGFEGEGEGLHIFDGPGGSLAKALTEADALGVLVSAKLALGLTRLAPTHIASTKLDVRSDRRSCDVSWFPAPLPHWLGQGKRQRQSSTTAAANGDENGSIGTLADFVPSFVCTCGMAGIRFDEEEKWLLQTDGDEEAPGYFKLLPVAVHEVGHVLGLSHAKNAADVMGPYYVAARVDPTANDIARCAALYGVEVQ